jgi:PAS domain S-box-containing protein
MALDRLPPEQLDRAIIYDPLCVAADTPLSVVVARMSALRGVCALEESAAIASGEGEPPERQRQYARSSCALVVEGDRLIGIFTERDLVRLSAQRSYDPTLPVADAMTRNPTAVKRSRLDSIFQVLAAFQNHHIRHLPVIDDDGRPIGLLTATALRQLLDPSDLLKVRHVGEVVNLAVMTIAPEASLLTAAQRMTEAHISCLVVARPARSRPHCLEPLGIITESDIVQYQALDLALERMPVEMAMSAPLFTLKMDDSLWSAHQRMQQKRVRRLVVVDELGYLTGLVTQSSLLKALDPVELYRTVQALQNRLRYLEMPQAGGDCLVPEEMQQLQAHLERSRRLVRLNHDLRHAKFSTAALGLLADNAPFVWRCDRAIVLRFDRQGQGFSIAATFPSSGPIGAATLADHGLRSLALDLDRRAMVLRSGDRAAECTVDEVLAHTADAPSRPNDRHRDRDPDRRDRAIVPAGCFQIYDRYNFRSALWIPLVSSTHPWGFLILGREDDRDRWTPIDQDLGNQLADDVLDVLDGFEKYEVLERELERHRRRAERLEIQHLQQQTLVQLHHRALYTATPQGFLAEAVDLVQRVLGVDYVGSFELQPSGTLLQLGAGCGWPNTLVGQATVSSDPTRSHAGHVLQAQTPIAFEDLRIERRFGGEPLLHNCRIVSGLGAPILGSDGAPLGVLGVYRQAPSHFTEDEHYFLQMVAHAIAQVIQRHRARLERDHFFVLARDILFITDASGEIQQVNPAIATLLGHPIVRVQGTPLQALIHSNDRPRFQELLQQVRDGLPQGEVEVRLRSQQQTWPWFSLRLVAGERDHRIYGTAREVGGSATQGAIAGNPGGHPDGDTNNDDTQITVSPEVRLKAQIETLRTVNSQLEAELRDRRRAEATRQENERRLLAIFEQTAIGIIYADLNGSWQQMNQRMTDLLRYDPIELMGLDWAAVVHPNDLKQVLTYLTETAATQNPLAPIAVRLRRRDGQSLPVHLSASCVRGGQERADGLVLLIHPRDDH